MNINNDLTITALATPKGRGALAIIRLSGKEALKVGNKVFSGNLLNVSSHTAQLGKITHEHQILDEVIATVFRSPNSYTGEDMVEFTVHGGPVIIEAVLEALIEAGATLAQPGEFTFRRFLSGKIDLLQAEAIVDMINANSRAALETAVNQLSGKLSGKVRDMRTALLSIQTELTASIDFPEEHLQLMPLGEMGDILSQQSEKASQLLAAYQKSRSIQKGITVVIAGKPNVGKSSLFNQILEEDRVIVSASPGTTRDLVDSTFELEGILFHLFDTAGIRVVQDHIEIEGVKKTWKQIAQADLILLLIDVSAPLEDPDLHLLEELNNEPLIVVFNKVDLGVDNNTLQYIESQNLRYCLVSALNGDGLEDLQKLTTNRFSEEFITDEVLISSLRHKTIIESVVSSLKSSLDNLKEETLEIVNYQLELAIGALNKLLGEEVDHDVLGEIFSKFCIGK